MTASFSKGVVKGLDFTVDQELRLKDNLQSINLLYTNIGFDYKLNKYIKISPVYRFIDKHKSDDSYGIRHRLMLDVAFKIKPGKFTLGYRARFQSEWRSWGYASELGNVPELYLRNLFKVQYKLTDNWSPYVATEIRFQISNPRIPYHNGFDRTRFMAGTSYDINDHNTAGIYFLYQKEWNVVDPQTLYILGLEYSLSID
jgi:hypothetical protein